MLDLLPARTLHNAYETEIPIGSYTDCQAYPCPAWPPEASSDRWTTRAISTTRNGIRRASCG